MALTFKGFLFKNRHIDYKTLKCTKQVVVYYNYFISIIMFFAYIISKFPANPSLNISTVIKLVNHSSLLPTWHMLYESN